MLYGDGKQGIGKLAHLDKHLPGTHLKGRSRATPALLLEKPLICTDLGTLRPAQGCWREEVAVDQGQRSPGAGVFKTKRLDLREQESDAGWQEVKG